MKIYELRTEIDCLIKNDDGECLLDQNQSITFNSPQKVLVYPLSTNRNQFPFFIDLNILRSGKFYSHYSIDEKELFLINSLTQVKNENIEKIAMGNKSCLIRINEENISFEYDNMKKTLELTQEFNSYSINKVDNFILLSLTGTIEELWAYNTSDNSLQHIFGNKIERVDNQIMVTYHSQGIYDNQIYKTYEISNNKLIEKKSSISHISPPSKIYSEKVIPIAFLEAVKDRDYYTAKSYLSQRLSESVSDEHLEKFFGNFDKIIPLSNNRYLIIRGDKFKVFRFVVSNNLIDDIEENEN